MDNSLRKKIDDTKSEYIRRYGKLDWKFTDEGLPWAIQDYHGSCGSLMAFTKDDWMVCKENGWLFSEVCNLCDERRFDKDVDNLEAYIQAVREDHVSAGTDNEFLELSEDDAIALVKDFYTWRNNLFPMIVEVYKLDF